MSRIQATRLYAAYALVRTIADIIFDAASQNVHALADRSVLPLWRLVYGGTSSIFRAVNLYVFSPVWRLFVLGRLHARRLGNAAGVTMGRLRSPILVMTNAFSSRAHNTWLTAATSGRGIATAIAHHVNAGLLTVARWAQLARARAAATWVGCSTPMFNCEAFMRQTLSVWLLRPVSNCVASMWRRMGAWLANAARVYCTVVDSSVTCVGQTLAMIDGHVYAAVSWILDGAVKPFASTVWQTVKSAWSSISTGSKSSGNAAVALFSRAVAMLASTGASVSDIFASIAVLEELGSFALHAVLVTALTDPAFDGLCWLSHAVQQGCAALRPAGRYLGTLAGNTCSALAAMMRVCCRLAWRFVQTSVEIVARLFQTAFRTLRTVIVTMYRKTSAMANAVAQVMWHLARIGWAAGKVIARALYRAIMPLITVLDAIDTFLVALGNAIDQKIVVLTAAAYRQSRAVIVTVATSFNEIFRSMLTAVSHFASSRTTTISQCVQAVNMPIVNALTYVWDSLASLGTFAMRLANSTVDVAGRWTGAAWHTLSAPFRAVASSVWSFVSRFTQALLVALSNVCHHMWTAFASPISRVSQRGWATLCRGCEAVTYRVCFMWATIMLVIFGNKRYIRGTAPGVYGHFGMDIRPAALQDGQEKFFFMRPGQPFGIHLVNRTLAACDAVVTVFGREVGVFRMEVDSSCTVTHSAYNQTPFIFEWTGKRISSSYDVHCATMLQS